MSAAITLERLKRIHEPGPVRVVRPAPAAPVSDADLAARLHAEHSEVTP